MIQFIKKHKTFAVLLLLVMVGVIFIIGPRKIARAAQESYNRWALLTMILDKIERFYVRDTDPDKLLNNAIDGMLSGLDPYSRYLPPDSYTDYAVKYNGFYGIGLKYTMISNKPVITSLVDGGPAEIAGLCLGDRILKIQNNSVKNLNAGDIHLLLSDDFNGPVNMSVLRPVKNDTLSFELPRRKLMLQSIPASFMLDQHTGYIKISTFTDSTPTELDIAFAELNGKGMKRLILDLRNNSGGDLEAAVNVADRFIEGEKIIVFTKGRNHQASKQYTATSKVTLPALPIIVFVNQASASGAEILAGAIQDWDRGLIVGRRTFGKALVQTEYKFPDGSALLLTTARYYTPLGRLIQRNPLSPDGQNDSQKKYTTPGRRTIEGGGGIKPDVQFKSDKQKMSEIFKRLYFAEENYFYQFADNYVNSLFEEEMLDDLQKFATEFEISDEMLLNFHRFLFNSGLKIDRYEFYENQTEIRNALKQEIAARIWGEEGRQRVRIEHDEHITMSYDYFPKARELLNL